MDREFPTTYRSRRYRKPDFFFPFALITAGIIWMLVNNGTIAVENLYRLIPLWPALLVLAGVGLMLRYIWWPLDGLLWLAAGALVIWLLTMGTAFLPTLSPANLKHETLHETLGQTTAADVNLDLSIHPTTVHALSDSQYLVAADMYTVNGATLDASGGAKKNVRVYENTGGEQFVFNPRFDQWLESASKPWDIGLAPSVPLALTVDASTGATTLNLDGLKVESLRVNASTGRLDLILPKGQANLPVRLDASTGGTYITLPADTPVELTVQGSTGGVRITLPEGASAQVEVRSGGLGGLNLPAGFEKVSGNSQDKEGVWQNNLASSKMTLIKIILDIGTGGITIR